MMTVNSWRTRQQLDQLSFFHWEVLLEGGRRLHESDWPMRLLRGEEEVKPHKHSAWCRHNSCHAVINWQ